MHHLTNGPNKSQLKRRTSWGNDCSVAVETIGETRIFGAWWVDLQDTGAVTAPVEGPPEFLAPSAASLIKQLAKDTKLSTLTATDNKAKNPWRNETFFLIRSLHAQHTHTRTHKSIQGSHLLHLPFMCGSPLLGTSQVGTVRKEWKIGEDSTSVLQFYDFLNVLERF